MSEAIEFKFFCFMMLDRSYKTNFKKKLVKTMKKIVKLVFRDNDHLIDLNLARSWCYVYMYVYMYRVSPKKVPDVSNQTPVLYYHQDKKLKRFDKNDQ